MQFCIHLGSNFGYWMQFCKLIDLKSFHGLIASNFDIRDNISNGLHYIECQDSGWNLKDSSSHLQGSCKGDLGYKYFKLRR